MHSPPQHRRCWPQYPPGTNRRLAGFAPDSVCKSRISTTRPWVTTASRLPVPAPCRTFNATSSTNRRDHQRPVRTTRWKCSPRRARAANASKSPGACSRWLDAEFRSTGSPCCCVHRRNIAPTSRRHSAERTFRFISHVARCDPTRPGAPSVPCSSAPPKACRRGASPSTFRLVRCLTRRPAARRPRLLRVATDGLPPTGSSFRYSRPMRSASSPNP